MSNFEIGDYVRVKNDGQMYSTYIEMAELFGMKKKLCLWSPADAKRIFEIKGSKNHLTQPITLIAHIEEIKLGAEFMIGVEGLETIEEPFKFELEEELFIV